MAEIATRRIKPQVGPQEAFLASSADIVIYGGAAGSGKSWGVLLEPLRHVVGNTNFAAVFFRRNLTQIKNPGGLWDESLKLYPLCGGQPVSHVSEWRWPKGGKVKFGHLEYDATVLDWQGAQIPLIVFDELTHFTQAQFFYMLSRNRSMCGVRPYVRATCNPDSDSWVAEFISWWIDQETGYPIPERSGVVRWFIRVQDSIVWGESREALILEHGNSLRSVDDPEQSVQPKSFTFIPAKLDDNPALTKNDPGYRANLLAMSRIERERLLHGNWKIRPFLGMYFNRSECTVVDSLPLPHEILKKVRRWDLAATEPTEDNPNPDWTAGLLMYLKKDGRYLIADLIHVRKKSQKVRELVLRTANNDGFGVRIGLSQDPGQAGKEQAESYTRELAGYTVKTIRETGDKAVRAEPFSAQWQAGNVDVLRASWNSELFNELESFGGGSGHDDIVDSASGAFLELTTSNLSVWSNLGK